MTPNPLRKEVPPNTGGRDFVIGDLHGSYSCFEHLLKAINFDKSKDRMFSVGDLIDRGPDSAKCLALLREDWFHAVLANHEEMMMHALNLDAPWYIDQLAASWFPNGGVWAHQAMAAYWANQVWDDAHYEIIQNGKLVESLPFIINVPTKDGGWVHIVHAELPYNHLMHGVTFTDDMLRSDEEVAKLHTLGKEGSGGITVDGFTWGRNLFYDFYGNPLTGDSLQSAINYLKDGAHPLNNAESLIISGHTTVRQPIRIRNFLNIDTGAFKSGNMPGYGLTCFNITENKLSTTDAFGQTTFDVEPLVIDV